MKKVFENLLQDIKPKPAPLLLLNGALPLQTAATICLLFQIFVSLSLAMVFVILETYVWFPYMTFFLAEAGCALVQILNVYERTTLMAVRSRFLFAIVA